jgi:hypothetical protein
MLEVENTANFYTVPPMKETTQTETLAPFEPTNELERMLASGVDIGSEEFVVELLKSEIVLWASVSDEPDQPNTLVLRTSEDEEGNPVAHAFTSAEAFDYYLKQNNLDEQDCVDLSGESLFIAAGKTHSILFNMGHELSPFFPKESLVPADEAN